jgi:GT2 family glycosyltransferase
MSSPHAFAPAAWAAEIARTLHPACVLSIGPGADALAAALGALGVDAPLAPPANASFDLVVCTGSLDAGTAADLASRTTSILLAGPDLPIRTLRALADLGFSPQPAFGAACFPAAVLLRRSDSGRHGLAGVIEVLENQRLAIERLDAHVARDRQQVERILHSRVWRTLCACGAPLLKAAELARRVARRAAAPQGRARPTPYERWIAQFERRDEPLIRLKLRSFARRPLFSILVPVWKPAPAYLERAIASVRAQSYGNWELCLVDDASASDEISAVLARAAAGDARVHVAALPAHAGISGASNAALALARGDFVGLLDHDDELSPDALFYAADAIDRHPEAGFLYSDEDKIDTAGNRYDPFFKPDWSPDLLLSENYCGHFLLARRDLVEQAGRFREEFDGAQDYDLLLRLAGCSQTVAHIARVLYHWRAVPGSAALDPEAKPFAAGAARRAVEDHLRRSGLAASVAPGCGPGRMRVRYAIPGGSHVGILIPSGGNAAALRACVESLIAKTDYPDYELLVIDNSRGKRIRRLVDSWNRAGSPVGYLDWRGRPFNYSAMNNAAARGCGSPLLLFLNDDTEVIAPGWLEAMVELAARPSTGAVGARLLYPDGRIQHAGIALDILESGGHAFRGLDGRARHYFDFPSVIRNVSAVTAACLLVRAGAFEQVGGFDEVRFPVSFNDVDFCLRLGRLGLRNLYTPHAVLRHRESLSRARRGLTFDPEGLAALRVVWGDSLDADPCYSPNLTRTAEDYSLRQRP